MFFFSIFDFFIMILSTLAQYFTRMFLLLVAKFLFWKKKKKKKIIVRFNVADFNVLRKPFIIIFTPAFA